MAEPWFPDMQDAIDLNQQSLEDHGQTNHALLRPEVLEGALGRARNYMAYENDLPKAAAALVHGVGQAQAFEDGNKRTVYHVGRIFLNENGHGHVSPLDHDDDELAQHLVGYGEGTHRMDHTVDLFNQRNGKVGSWKVSDVEYFDTTELLQECYNVAKIRIPLPQKSATKCNTLVTWEEVGNGLVYVWAKGGSVEERQIAEELTTLALEDNGYKRGAVFLKTAAWPDIEEKAMRLIQSGAVTILRNGYNNIVAHVKGDHDKYQVEIGRDDPDSRAVTSWTCECPWADYAFGRTRKWKRFEQRPCSHCLAVQWKAQSTPLDDDATGTPPTPGQKGPVMPPPGGAPAPMPDGGPAPDGSGGPTDPGAFQSIPTEPTPILPPSPAEQFAALQPAIPGATPVGMPAPPNSVSVPGARVPTPANPTQLPGGVYSKVDWEFDEWKLSSDKIEAGQFVRLNEDEMGQAVGPSAAHGDGEWRNVPKHSIGEVMYQDPTTGLIEANFPLHESGPLEAYHVNVFLSAEQVTLLPGIAPPGPFRKRRR